MTRTNALNMLNMASDHPQLAGWYHNNARVAIGSHSFVIRTERWTADFDPEPRQFREDSILLALAAAGIPCPRLRHTSQHPKFMVLDYIPGAPVSEAPYPTAELHDSVARLSRALSQVERRVLNLLASDRRFARKSYRSSTGFHSRLVGWLGHVYEEADHPTHAILSLFGIQENPFPALRGHQVGRRHLRLCHGDLNPTNCLWDGNSFHFIDWELALWGDPAWDVACYLHRFSFERSVEAEALDRLVDEERPDFAELAGLMQDIATYRRVEMLRSVVVDAARLVASRQVVTEAQVQSYVRRTSTLLGVDTGDSTIFEQVGLLLELDSREVS